MPYLKTLVSSGVSSNRTFMELKFDTSGMSDKELMEF